METLRTLVVTKIAPLKDLHEKTVGLYTASLDRFAEYLGREPVIDDLEDLVVATFLRWRSENCRRLWGKKPLSRASLAKDSAHLRSIWNWCAKKRMKKSNGDLLEFPDYKRPTVPRPRPRAYTADDLRRLMDAARHRRGYLGDIPAAWFWTTILRALFETGGRIGEMISLRWAECDLEQMSITFLAETRKGSLRDDYTGDLTAAGWSAGGPQTGCRGPCVALDGAAGRQQPLRIAAGAVPGCPSRLPVLPQHPQGNRQLYEIGGALRQNAAWALDRGDGRTTLLRRKDRGHPVGGRSPARHWLTGSDARKG
jgi:hypothetical protein